jgi:hypothetical protein
MTKTLGDLYSELRTAQIHKFVAYFDFNITPYLTVELSYLVCEKRAQRLRKYILDTFPQVTKVQLQMQRNPHTEEIAPYMRIWTTSQNFALDIQKVRP